jgi:methyl-accepting chemotaxis protein
MLSNMKIASKLSLIGGIGALLTVVIAIEGLHSMAQMTDSLESVYEHRAEGMNKLARIMSDFDANYADILRGFQHDPEGKTYQLHDHPVTEHTQRIAKTIKRMDEVWSDYRATIHDPEEIQLADDFNAKRVAHEQDAIRPALAALDSGDYRKDTISAFLVAYRSSGNAARKAMQQLIDYQAMSAKQMYQDALGEYHFDRNLMIVLIVVVGGLMAGIIVTLARSITIPLGSAVAMAEAVSRGELRHQVNKTGDDETGRMLAAMARMQASLRDVVTRTQDHARALNEAAMALSTAARQSAEMTEKQSESASSMAAAVEEMTVSIDQVRDHARDANSNAHQSGERSHAGGEVVHSAAREIGRISDAVNTSAQTIRHLESYSSEITSIVKVIHDIADQTNLLALNAAIEAARAGEQGRGFAVVADEVRKLAERTASSTKQIATMIDKVQAGARQAASEMEAGVELVGKGVGLAHQAGDSITNIQDAAARVEQAIHDIALALEEQASASQEIARGVETIAQASEENSASVSQTLNASQRLQSIASELNQTVAIFKL